MTMKEIIDIADLTKYSRATRIYLKIMGGSTVDPTQYDVLASGTIIGCQYPVLIERSDTRCINIK